MTACRALQTLTLLKLDLSQFQFFKLSSSKLGGLSNFPSRRVSTPQTLQSFELPNSRTFILSSLSNFDLGNIQTFEPETFRSLKPSISQTRDLSHKPQIKSQANLSNSKPSKVRTFKLSIFQSLRPSNLRKCKLSKSQTLKLRRPIELDRGKSLKFEFEAASRARKFES